MRNRIILLLIGFMCYAGMGNAQEDKTEKAVPAIVSDSVEVAAPDSTVQAVLMAADSVGVPEVKMKLAFKPNPTKAVLFALVPGLGQIYNRKYWKLPIVYGGLMGCMYAVTWNNKNYKDYSTAYKDIMYDAAKNLENPESSLEESFQYYNEGMQLLKRCNETIDSVEKKVLVLDEEGETYEF